MTLNNNHNRNRPFYQERPYIYIILAFVCFAFAKKTVIGLIAGLILLATGFYVLHLRKKYQDANDQVNQKYNIKKK
jgi:hypothetical protein